MQSHRFLCCRYFPLFIRANVRQTLTRNPILFVERSFASSNGKPTRLAEKAEFDLGQRLATEEADYMDAITLLNTFQLKKFQSLRSQKSGQNQNISAKERTMKWLDLLNCDINHLLKPKVIHVAGSKGKGTTCLYCNHILHEYQRITGVPKKIGCYTSPHLLDVRERIQINNEKLPKWLFSYYLRRLHDKIRTLTLLPGLETPPVPGYPGFLALLAIYIFILEEVDIAILETGIGGERDSTNVFPNPVATGITTIGLDHVKTLGNSVEQIAWHKAGIFKPGSPAFAVVQDEAVLQVFRNRAEEKHVAGELKVVNDQIVRQYGVKVYPDMLYQRLNAALAISLSSSYLESEYPHFSMNPHLARTLKEAELPGRCQVKADEDITWLISVAHNEVSLMETVAWFKETVQCSERARTTRVLIFNQNFNKSSPRDPYLLLKVIHEGLCADSPVTLEGVIFCTDQSDKTGKEKLDLIDLRTDRKVVSSLIQQRHNAKIWEELDGSGNIAVVHTISEAVHLVREKYKRADVLVTGSSFLASGMLHILKSSSLG